MQNNNTLQKQVSELTKQLRASRKREDGWKLEAKKHSHNAHFWRKKAEEPRSEPRPYDNNTIP